MGKVCESVLTHIKLSKCSVYDRRNGAEAPDIDCSISLR